MLALVDGTPPRLVRDRPRPARPAGEALLRMRLAGICDTDLQLSRGYMGYQGVLGHEVVAEVVDSESPTWRGRRVVADINAGCGHCTDCAVDGHHCATRTVLGILGRDGALAEELVVPERCLIAVPDDLPDERAVFAEPLAAALHVLDEVPEKLARPAVVLGDGKLGLLIAMALGSEGVPVTLVGHHREKLELVRPAGVRGLLESDLEPSEHASELVVEATGSATGLALALSLALPRGKIVLKTTVAGRLDVDLAPVVVNELSVVGSRCGDLGRAIARLGEGRLDPTPLVAARYPLAQAEQALSHAARRGTLKVLVEGA